jgi:hypothetical protein
MYDVVTESARGNEKEVEGIGRSLIRGTIAVFSLRDLGKPCRTSVTRESFGDEFRSQGLPNAEPEWQPLDH